MSGNKTWIDLRRFIDRYITRVQRDDGFQFLQQLC